MREGKRLTAASLDFWIYFAIGLVVIVVFSHRQFNEKSWRSETNIIQRLAPREIIGKSTYYSAYLLYLMLIVGIYALLCFSAKAVEILTTVVELLLQQAPGAGAVGGVVGASAPPDGGAAEVRQVTQNFADRNVAHFPLLVSLGMGALMRFPYVQRVEQWVRGFAHWIFGIPTMQMKLRERMLATHVDLDLLEGGLEFDDPAERYSERIDRYAGAGAALLGATFPKAQFREQLGTIMAFRVWVARARIWPADGLAATSETYTALKDKVLEDISVLERDLELLAAPAPHGRAERGQDEAMRRELWGHRIQEVDCVCKDVCSVMALFAPNSDLPKPSQPTAPSLIAFLADSAQINEAWRAQRNLSLIAITLCAVWSALMGASFAYGLRWAIDEAYARAPMDAIFSEFATGRNFAVTGLLAFGLATYVAVQRRSAAERRSRGWANAFAGGVWPFDQWLAIYARCFAWTLVTFVAYYVLVTFMVPPSEIPRVVSDLRGTLVGYIWEIVAFGLVAGLHGVFVAILMDAEEKRLRGRRLTGVMALHVALLGIAGLAVGIYVSRLRGSADPEVLQLRMLVYAAWAAGVALIAGWTISSASRHAFAVPEVALPRSGVVVAP